MTEGGTTHYYLGEDDCKKATCPRKQEFPQADSPYCIFHAYQDWASTNIERPGVDS
jgi:hypothetical protein